MTTDRRASPADTVVLPFLIVEVRLVKKKKKKKQKIFHFHVPSLNARAKMEQIKVGKIKRAIY